MPVYTVHEPLRRTDDTIAHTARFVFVRDGFHVWAFLLTPLWMLRYRMWLELIAYVLVVGVIAFALRRLGITGAGFSVAFLIALLVGIEASSLRRWKLARRGFENLGVVVGDDIEEAERRFFRGWVAPSRPAAAAPSQPAMRQPESSSDIIGLFPQPGTRP